MINLLSKFEVLLACLLHDFEEEIKLSKIRNIKYRRVKTLEEISGHYMNDSAKRVDGKYILIKGVKRLMNFNLSIEVN